MTSVRAARVLLAIVAWILLVVGLISLASGCQSCRADSTVEGDVADKLGPGATCVLVSHREMDDVHGTAQCTRSGQVVLCNYQYSGAAMHLACGALGSLVESP